MSGRLHEPPDPPLASPLQAYLVEAMRNESLGTPPQTLTLMIVPVANGPNDMLVEFCPPVSFTGASSCRKNDSKVTPDTLTELHVPLKVTASTAEAVNGRLNVAMNNPTIMSTNVWRFTMIPPLIHEYWID